MKRGLNFKKLIKAISMLEMVIAMSITTFLFVGFATLFSYMGSMTSELRTDIDTVYRRSQLKYVLDQILDNKIITNITTNVTFYEITADYTLTADNLPTLYETTETRYPLFTDSDNTNYYFAGQHFISLSSNNEINDYLTCLTPFEITITKSDSLDSVFQFEIKRHVDSAENANEGESESGSEAEEEESFVFAKNITGCK